MEYIIAVFCEKLPKFANENNLITMVNKNPRYRAAGY
jgi:hypothetical protein